MTNFFLMIQGLHDAGVEHVIIGGIAAALQGSDYATNDLDICYNTTPENIERLAKLLASWQTDLRDGDADLPFYMDTLQIRSTPIMTLRTRLGDIDILDRVEGIGEYADCLAASEVVTVQDTPLHILTLSALIAAKKATGRPKDLMQLPTLEGLRKLKRK